MTLFSFILSAMLLLSCGGDDHTNSGSGTGNGESGGGTSGGSTSVGVPIKLADPTIFRDNDGTYYLYGTSSDIGFEVYKSTDLEHWSGPCGKATGKFALSKEDSFGEKWFWAPQVFSYGNRYYMAYCADEHLAIASADSPLGPFKQTSKAQIPASMRQIDPFVFFDDDGKIYIYHVREVDSNSIYVAELSNDFTTMNESTAKPCVKAASEGWENVSKSTWPVAEGPTVVKMGDTYYMFYSANGYTDAAYAVGVATAKSPLGPWTKPSSPLISTSVIGYNGTGHGDLFTDNDGNLQYVMHTHYSNTEVAPRRTGIVTLQFNDGAFHVKDKSFRYLYKQ